MRIQLNKQLLLPTGIGVAGVALGFGGGFLTAQLRWKRKYEEVAEGYQDLQVKVLKLGDQLKTRSLQLEAFSLKLDSMAAVEEQARAAGHPSVEEVVTPTAEVVSIFPNVDVQAWDQEKENKEREKHQGRPYVISVAEYQENELGLTQHTYTWYEGDGVLSDEEDVPVYNYTNVVGELKFGYGSGDPSIVYVRNERGKREYEIIKDSGHFAVVVQGLEIEDQHAQADLKHANVRRMRRDD